MDFSKNRDGTLAPTLLGLLMAIALTTVLVYAMPKKYAIWFPYLILMGYAARHPAIVNEILDVFRNTLNSVGNTISRPVNTPSVVLPPAKIEIPKALQDLLDKEAQLKKGKISL